MKDWLVEIIDQIAIGEFLANSSLSCGQRFGLIAIDNAIEFMLIAYVEIHKQLVGGHKTGGVTKKDWDETKKHFPKLLNHVALQEANLQPMESEINRYHDFRNTLYHSGAPVTTASDRVNKYAKIAKEVMVVLFGIRISENEWNEVLNRIARMVSNSDISKTIKLQVTFEILDGGVIKFITNANPKATEVIGLCLYGYSSHSASKASKSLLIQSLSRSGYPLNQKVLNARLADLRNEGWLQNNQLILSGKGRKELAKKFIL